MCGAELPMCLPINFLESITQNFSKEQELGRGGHGVVYKVLMIGNPFLLLQQCSVTASLPYR